MKKIYFWSILTLSMMVFLPQQAGAQSDVSVWDGFAESWTQGDGTENNPYLIENARHLAYIAEMVNAGVTHYDSTYFKLTTNVLIDSITAWEPIGMDDSYYFAGHFDGGNHIITIYFSTSSMQYVGIFGCANNGSFANLTSMGRIKRSSAPFDSYAGGICGYSTSSFFNCRNEANISSYSYSSTYALYYAYNYAGGICGSSSSSFTNCHNTGHIYSSSLILSTLAFAYAGGICGEGGSFNNCSNIGGGVYATGSNSEGHLQVYAGGICGNNAGNITNCFNTGNTSSPNSNSYYFHSYTSGICFSSSNGKNCYNVGLLTGANKYGIASSATTNCYYLNTCGTSSGGTPKTEAQMKSSSFPVMLNSDSVVYIMDTLNINQGYPIFANEMYVLTEDANYITFNSATLNGVYSGNADVKGFRYKAESDSVYSTVYCSLSEPYSYSLSGLSDGTTYQYYYFVQKNGVTYYGNAKTFSTITCDVSINLTMPTDAVCTGDSVLLIASAESAHTSQFSYQWSTGESGNTILPSSNGLYTVTATADNGCSQTSSYTLSLYPSPAGIISGDTILCEGNNAVLSASGAWSYQWNTGTQGNSITVAAPGVYSCTFTNEYGCTSERSVTVSTLSDIAISGNPHVCEGGSTLLSAPAADSCLWSTGAQNFSILVSTPGSYTVTIYQGQCSASASVVVTSASLPTPSILGNTTICQNQTTTLTANGGNSYLWNNGSTNSSISVSQSGVYTVTATNSEGCSASTNVTVTVNPLPTVSITGNSSFCQGDNTTLTATGASTYAWSNSSTMDAITVNAAGTYTVTGTDANGCTNTATHTVSVNPTYNIPLTHSICEGESYNFYGQNITTAGTYTHTLQTVNGCDSVLTLVVTLKALPTIAISGNTTLCEGESTTLTANGGISYNWNNGSATNSINVAESGVYAVTATNAEGCSTSTNITITVNPLPNVSISGNSSFCQGDNVTLTSTGASTYAWSNSSTDNTITVNNAGTYTVTGTDANGCTNTATKAVSVNPTYNIPLTHSICEGESYNFYGQNITTAGTYTHTLQTVNGCDSVLTLVVTVKTLPTIAISGNTTLCEGESTTLTANGGISYNWSNGSANNSINVVESGVYTVTATNVEGCSATASATVTVNPLPIVVIGGNTSICEGGSTTLTASGADTYSWSTGDNTASATINDFGIYNVTGTSAAGCSSVASVTVLVSQLPIITITGETDICAGESTTLTANGGTTYLWSNGTTDATLTVSNAGTYQVIGYNEAGCNDIASTTVNVWQPASSEFSIECPDSCYIWNDQTYCVSGDYTQTLQTVHGCDSVVTLHLTITVGIDDHVGFDFKVYPNPTSSVVNVECTMNNVQFGDMELQLVDAYGRLLNVVKANNYSPLQTTQIDLSRYAKGIYFIKAVADGKTVAVRKVVKQ